MGLESLIEEITREVLAELGQKDHIRLAGQEVAGDVQGQCSRGGPAEARLASMINHTLLKPEATKSDLEKLCEEAKTYSFCSVCVNPTNVRLAARLLKGSTVKVCTVIGFPLGASTAATKAVETRDAIANGAGKVDMVINVGALKSGDYDLCTRDIKAVVDAADGQALVKVILETCLLTDEEKRKACLLAKNAGANFVKTSTGFSKGGATVEDVTLMRQVVGAEMGVRHRGASGTGKRPRKWSRQAPTVSAPAPAWLLSRAAARLRPVSTAAYAPRPARPETSRSSSRTEVAPRCRQM